MKKQLTLIAMTLAAPFIWAQTTTTEKSTTTKTEGGTTTETTTKTTTGTGTITEYEPGKTFVVKEANGPVHYRFGEKVVYVTKGGKTIPEAELKERMRVGAHVSVHYVKEGDGMLVSRVVVDD